MSDPNPFDPNKTTHPEDDAMKHIDSNPDDDPNKTIEMEAPVETKPPVDMYKTIDITDDNAADIIDDGEEDEYDTVEPGDIHATIDPDRPGKPAEDKPADPFQTWEESN